MKIPACLVLLLTLPAVAHGGQLDSYGCFTDRATGRYECLRGQYRGDHFTSQGDMLRQMRAKDALPPPAASGSKRLAPPATLVEPGSYARRRPVVSYPVTVMEVPDGATVIVLPAGKTSSRPKDRVTIRLYGLDFPAPSQPLGLDAANFLREAVLNAAVEVRPAPIGKDKAGRTVAIVETGGRTLQELLLESGWAWVAATCGRPECAAWKILEQEARAAGKGQWREKE